MNILRFAFAALLLILLNTSGILSQTTGKISGKVTDEKGVPLGGATVKIENTNLGANADEAGDYVILNIPVGTYSVRASYLGYETVIQTEVKVSVDITTRLDFMLKETGGIKTEEIEVITKRNTLAPDQSGKIIEKEFIENTGIRGIENLASKTAGVVQDERGTSINIRGGRTNETQIIIDGVVTSNPLDGSSTAYVSNSVLQELAVLTGGFSAQYGNVLSGVINVTTKQGSSNYTGGFEFLTDQFTSNDNVKGPFQGYKLANINLGGPIFPTKKLRNFASFYIGGERNDNLVSNPSWITPELGLPNDILPNYWFKRWSGNAKLRFDFASLNKKTPIQLLFGGLFSNTERLGFVQSYMLFNSHRNPLIKEDNIQFYGKINHQISGKVFYELQGTYFDTRYKEGDPEFMDDFFAYGDPLRIPELVTPQGIISRVGLDQYGLFAKYNRVRSYFEASRTSYISGNFIATAQLKNNEIKFGGEYKYHTLRYYELRGLHNLYPYRDSSAELQQKIFEGATGLANYFGYSWRYNSGPGTDPELVDDGYDGAKHPIIAAFFVQDKIEFNDFTLNAGIRADYLDPNTWRIKNIRKVAGDDNIFGPEDIEDNSEPSLTFSPRLGFSFPVTEKTIFHAQYGRFVQLPQLNYLYNSYKNMAFWINNAGFSGSFGNPNLKPEKTTSYEIGIKQFFGDKLSVNATLYYKETEGLIGIAQYPQLPNQIQVYENQDYGTIKGIDLMVDFRRTNGLAVSLSYSLAYANGTGSNPNSSSIAAWVGDRLPKFTFPLSYDQRHTGNLNVDFRLRKDELPKGFWGDFLDRLGLNAQFSFNSGRPYSLKDPRNNPFGTGGAGSSDLLSAINANYGPWNFRLDLKLDKTFKIWKTDVNIYILAINVTNSELVNNVWETSGLPGSTGFLSTSNGINTANSYENPTLGTTRDEYIRRFNLLEKAIGNYGPPRQFRFGLKFSF